jgi:hypothetical protein
MLSARVSGLQGGEDEVSVVTFAGAQDARRRPGLSHDGPKPLTSKTCPPLSVIATGRPGALLRRWILVEKPPR